MDRLKVESSLKNRDLSLKRIKEIVEFFLNDNSYENIELFLKLVKENFNSFDEDTIYKVVECIDIYLNYVTLDDYVKSELLNAKTFSSLLLSNKYAALDSAFKFKNVHNVSFISRFLNFNYLVGIYYTQGLYKQALLEGEKFISSVKDEDFSPYNRFIYCANFCLVYAKLNDYKNFKRLFDEASMELQKFYSEELEISLILARICGESILYDSNKDIIDYEGNVKEYKALINKIFNRELISFDTIDTHVEIIESLIEHNKMKDAEDICIDILSNLKTKFFKKEIYKCLKKIYEKTNDSRLFDLMKEYLTVLEEIGERDKLFYNKYINNAIRLYQRSNDYANLLENYEHDTLTNCYSRGAFMNLSKAKEKMSGYLIFLDLNDLKFINDHLGHKFGDEYIVLFATKLQNAFLGSGTCYRLGGDEFIVITDNTTENEIIFNINKLCQDLDTIKDKYPDYDFSFSAGISKFEDNLSVDDVLNQADQAMYIAKNNHTEIYHFYNNNLQK